MKKLFSLNLIFLLLITSTFLYSQNTGSITQIEKLQTFAKQKAIQYEKQKAEAIEWATLNGYPIRVDIDGRLMEIQYIDEFGKPQYYITDNADAASTISTDQVYSGGSAGLNLDGSGITVREWDGGGVLLTHQEYGGRVVMGDGTVGTHYHSTHVAGTIMAGGVVSAAKGMAFNANLRAFDWSYDESEMAIEAAAGALMSNHSYGFIRGWSNDIWYGNPSISTLEDYKFGFYDSYSQEWDQIAHDAPYYLIVKSAGNDRNDDGPGPYPPDGNQGTGYDCIGQHGIAKNILTVGAIYDIPGGYIQPADVVMTDFSSWGPADDGRIKPDIVTNGYSLYSTDDDSDDDYRTLNGTSMSAPSATGSLALLQQHWENLNGSGNYMLASTLKALAIHTADEAGASDGPDYEYGWGLMNTETAALKISEDQTLNVMDEISLSNGSSYTRSVYSNGTEPLKATICWRDVPGTPVAAVLDPINPMLVNDLDLRITIGASTYYPWKLERDNPSNAATNISENDVDNVEVVYIASPAAGDYTVTVDHDGTLSGGPQTFSIILSGISLINVPVADFSGTPLSGDAPLSVSFTDASTGTITSYAWTFGDGGTSTQQNPTYIYNTPGTYDVSLTVTGPGGSDTETKTSYITVTTAAPVADFSGTPLSGVAPLSVSFTDASTGTITSYAWTFGDGGTSTQQNPSYDYGTPGIYDVSLTVTGPGGSDTETKTSYITVTTAAPVADFSGTPLSGVAPLSVSFTDASTGTITSYAWTFGDGGASTLQNPTYIYNTPGTYDVSLTVTGPGGSDTETKTSYITVTHSVPVADFSGTPLSGVAPLSVSFTDASTGTITSYAWTFGDGGASTLQNPTYIYNTPGTYDVSLTVTGPGGSDTETKTSYITVTHPVPVADFSGTPLSGVAPLSVSFTDASTGTITSYSWTFGDGGTSTQQNPSYVYNTPGTYTVSLMVTGPGGSDTETKTDYITVTHPAPVADFSGTPLSGVAPLSVSFTDASTGTITSYAWTFGDGGTSTQQNPSYVYNTPGTYTVSLMVTGPGGSDTETKTDYITVTHPAPVADFSGTPLSGVAPLSVSFTDASTGTITSYAWTFGDGGTSTQQNPSYVYNTPGTYTVSLTVTGPGGANTETKTDYINVTIPPPDADFIADNTTPETTETVNFTDLSTNAPTSWAWVFTPSTITYMNSTNASSQNPQVRFDAEGLYDVQLTATNAIGSDVELKLDYINCTNSAPPPDADFVADNTNPNTDETVNFTDLSTNSPTSWAWVFTPSTVTYMNGTNANSQHPKVRFDNTGLYDVELTATNAVGSDTEIKTDYIDATDPPPATDFIADNLTPLTNETVNFTDLSTNNPTSWTWVFTPSTITYMNGTNSNSQHPQVQFDAAGLYTVELTATNAGGSDTEIKTDYINASDPQSPPVADFVADNLNPTIEETVNFTDLSTNIPTSWAWVFTPSTITYMDGTNANSQHPKVRFDIPGAYTVELTATNSGGSDTEIKTDYINATVVPPVADFVADNTTPDVGETVTFTDLSTNTPTSWLWSFTPATVTYVSGTDQNSQHPQLQFNATGLYTVELTATNGGGSDTETKPGYINVGDVFEVIATATPDEICFGESSQLHAFPSGGSGNYTFLWTSDPPGYYSNLQNPTVSPEVTTTYTVEVNDGSQSVFDDVTVTVNQLPVITLGDWPDLLCNQEEPPVQLTADPPGGIYSGPAVTMNGLFDPEIAPLGWNVITYTYEDGNGCENAAQDSIYVDDCVGIYSMFSENAHVNLFPNPNTGEFTVTSNFTIIRIVINNQMGKLVLSEESESDEIHFNMILPRGLYFVRTFVSDKKNKIRLVNKKLMIQ